MESCYNREIFNERIGRHMDKKWLRQQLEARGRGAQAALAAHLGLSASVTNKLVNGSRRIMADEADLIRSFLEPAHDDAQGALALGSAGGPAGGLASGAGRRLSAPAPAALAADRPDIPVWASAAAGDEDGTMILTDSPIDFIRRSELMQGVANPFAFYIVGDSMLERFAHGDQAVINPSLPLRPGDDCVFIHHAADGTMFGLVKRLLRSGAEHWRVRQLNPRRDFELPKRKWSSAWRIVETRHRG